jgi:AraC family transcriptional regulator
MNDRICLIDCRDGRTREAVAVAPQLSSSRAPWNGIMLEKHRLPAFDAPEVMLLEPFLTINVEGAGEVMVKRGGRTERLSVSPGSVFVLGPGPVPPIHVCGWLTSIFISLKPWMLAEYATDLIALDVARLRNTYSVPDSHFYHIGMALNAEIEQQYPGGRLYGESLATALVAHLLSRYSERGAVLDSRKAGIGSRRLRKVLDYIEENLGQDLSMTDLGTVAELSPCRFARGFKEAVGLPPHQFVMRKRIARARAMLEASTLSIAEIAANLGFESQSHFTAVFHKLVGTTPRAYREDQGVQHRA